MAAPPLSCLPVPWRLLTESDHEIRVISFRKATRREAQIDSLVVQDRLGVSREVGSGLNRP